MEKNLIFSKTLLPNISSVHQELLLALRNSQIYKLEKKSIGEKTFEKEKFHARTF